MRVALAGNTTQQVVGTTVSAGAPIAIAAAKGAALAVPVVGAAVAGVLLAANLWLGSIAKKNAQKAATTQIVNEAEQYLKQNLAAYQSLSNPTESERATALSIFDTIWREGVVGPCGSGQFDAAGQRCVSDRDRGGKWDWFTYYRDPIANSQTVPDAVGTSDNSIAGIDAGLLLPLAALGIGAIWLAGRN